MQIYDAQPILLAVIYQIGKLNAFFFKQVDLYIVCFKINMVLT